MTICFTGHRPNKLKGYDPKDNKELLWVLHVLVESFIKDGYTTFITGMALGVDMWAARVVLRLKRTYPNIKLLAAVPCLKHSCKWPRSSQKEYEEILSQVNEVFLVTKSEYTPQCMQTRNEFMVDNSDLVIAVWDGTPGGTGNCVRYAEQQGLEIFTINPKNF